MAKKTQHILLYILGSLLYLSIPMLVSPDTGNGKNLFTVAPFRREFVSHVLLLGFFCLNYTWLVPRYYLSGRKGLFFLLVVLCFIITAFLPQLMMHSPKLNDNLVRFNNLPPADSIMPGNGGIPPPDFGPGGHMRRRQLFLPPMYVGPLLHFLLIFFLSFLLRLSKRLGHIQNEKLKTEVSYLKAQINPHFLFNTLNSLYALTLEKSDNAPEAVLKLSEMMRYVVTESGRDHVALESEINYLKNYISLQRLRMDAGTQFNFTVKGDMAGRQISPMLLIPFIENAFKYGLNPEEKAEIDITIACEGPELLLAVKNKKVAVVLPQEEESGHGLENTRQRLDYLYPERYLLSLKDREGYFEVLLKIKL